MRLTKEQKKPENECAKRQCLSYLEESFHSSFVPAKASAPFYGNLTKRPANEILDAYCDDYSPADETVAPLIFIGPPGCGKSSIIANWILQRKACRKEGKEFLFYHFAGCSRNSISVERTLRRLMEGLKKTFDITLTIHPNDERLACDFPHFLQSAAKKGRLVLIIDGVQRIVGKDGESGIRWLPQHYPKNTRVVLSLTIPSPQLINDPGLEHSTQSQERREAKEAEKMLLEMRRRAWNFVEVGHFKEDEVSVVINELDKIAQNISQTIKPTTDTYDYKLKIPDLLKMNLLSNLEAMNPLYLATMVRSVVYASALGYNALMCCERWCPANNMKALMQSVLSIFELRSNKDEGALPLISDPILAQSLILLCISRHGLFAHELKDILIRLHINEKNNLNIKGRLDTLKTQMFRKVFKDKQRLIDIFRSFDKDRNGKLSREELLRGFQQLDINVDKELVDVFVADIDANSDGTIDYREAIEGLEKHCRQVFHGATVHYASTNETDSKSLSKSSQLDDFDFDSLYQKLFCLGVLLVGDNVLSLPLENEELRRAIFTRYIDLNSEAKWRLFLVNYFSEQEPSLRRCEELLWHLCQGRQLVPLKNTLLDLRTFDIMYNDELFKGELGGYVTILARTGTSHKTYIPVPKHSSDIRLSDCHPFDLVIELSHAIDCWYKGTRPSALRLCAMINQMAKFLQWFDDHYSVQDCSPCMMRSDINLCYEKIGDTEGRNGVQLKALQLGETIDAYISRLSEPSAVKKSYLLDRWVWIQIPWILVRACELAAINEGLTFWNQASTSESTEIEDCSEQIMNQTKNVPLPNSSDMQNCQSLLADKQHSNVIREMAQSKASVSKKSVTFRKAECLEQQLTLKRTPGNPSAISKKGSTREADALLISENDTDTVSVKKSDKVDCVSKVESSFHSDSSHLVSIEVEERHLSQQLGNVRNLYDGLALELQEKRQRFFNLEHQIAQEELGRKQSGNYLERCNGTIKLLQLRLEKVSEGLKYVSRIGELFEAVDSRLLSCDPSADKKLLTSLEQQIVLCTQKISDMKKERDTMIEETDRTTKRVIPKLKNKLADLRSQRAQIETKVEAIRRILAPSPENDPDNSLDRHTAALAPTNFSSLCMSFLNKRRSVYSIPVIKIANTSNLNIEPSNAHAATRSDEALKEAFPSNDGQYDYLSVLLEKTGAHSLEEAAIQISSIQTEVNAHSGLRDSLINEVSNLKKQLREISEKLELVQISSDDQANADFTPNNGATNIHVVNPDLGNGISQSSDKRNSKRVFMMNQLIQNIRTGVGHVNRMLFEVKLDMGSAAYRLNSNICADDDDVRKLRLAGFLLQHVKEKMLVINHPPQGRRASITSQLAAKQLDLAGRRRSVKRNERTQSLGSPLFKFTKQKQCTAQNFSSNDDIRVKTRKEADKYFEAEMKQISLKLENDSDGQVTHNGFDKDTSVNAKDPFRALDNAKFLQPPFNDKKREKGRIRKNRTIELEEKE